MPDKKIKIVRIIARLNVGGPAIHTILLTDELNDGRFESVLIAGPVEPPEKDMGYLVEKKGVRPVIIPDLLRRIDPVKDISAFFSILRILRKERPDIVHTHTAKAGTLGRAAAVFAGVPVRIHTFHGHIFDSYFNKPQTALFLFVERVLAVFSKYILVVSEAQKREIVDRYKIAPAGKVRVMPLGLELEKFSSIERGAGKFRAELGVPDGCLAIGIVGRLVPVKNHRMFLEACRKLFDMAGDIKIRCVVVGDGQERASLEKYAEGMGIRSKVIFVGWKEEMSDVYADLDIVALTSNNEGTPVALIEALASGRPVVSTDVGGVKDVVDDGVNGYLVPAGDVSGFAGRLFELAADSRKRDMLGKNGRSKVMKAYSKDRLVIDMKALYEEALS